MTKKEVEIHNLLTNILYSALEDIDEMKLDDCYSSVARCKLIASSALEEYHQADEYYMFAGPMKHKTNILKDIKND